MDFVALYDNPSASCRRIGCNTLIPLGIRKSTPCLCHQAEDLVIPYIGPEIIAVLLNKRTLERKEPFISGCLMKQVAAKAAGWFIARFVSEFFAIKAKRNLYSQPPSTRCDICSSARNRQHRWRVVSPAGKAARLGAVQVKGIFSTGSV
jgi:hypothetical protein